MDGKLQRAYLSTTYVAGPARIRIGEIPEIDADSWAFITAMNPRSKEKPAGENGRRMEALERDLRGYRMVRGTGQPPRGEEWEPEESFLVLDISREEAVALGRKYDQNAIVYGERGQPAELVEC